MNQHQPPGRIHGHVVRSTDGQPVAKASVRVWDDIVAVDLQRTNSKGKFTSRLLFAGTYKIEAEYDGNIGTVDNVQVELAETTNVTIPIGPPTR